MFPSRRGQPISNATLRKLLIALGVPCVPHGFRASVGTWMAEHGVPDEVAELSLGHTHKSVPPGIDLLAQRRAVLEQWGICNGGTGPDRPSPSSPSQHNETPGQSERKQQWLNTHRNALRSGPCPLTGPNYWAGPTVSPCADPALAVLDDAWERTGGTGPDRPSPSSPSQHNETPENLREKGNNNG